MLKLDALPSMEVMIATPVYGFGAAPLYTASLFRTQTECMAAGMVLHLEMVMGESLVTRARNRLVSTFLSRPTATHLFFIDADIGWTPEGLARVLLADKDVCAGVYPIKRYDWPADGLPDGLTREAFEAMFTPYPYNPVGNSVVSDEFGFAEVKEAPTGFMCIKRDVFRQMRAHYPDLNYIPEDPAPNQMPGTHFTFFDEVIEPETRRLLSEDFGFCYRWRALGGKVWIDLHSKLSHVGAHTWRGNMLEHLRMSPMRKG